MEKLGTFSQKFLVKIEERYKGEPFEGLSHEVKFIFFATCLYYYYQITGGLINTYYIRVCVYIYINIYIYIHAYIHTYIHIIHSLFIHLTLQTTLREWCTRVCTQDMKHVTQTHTQTHTHKHTHTHLREEHII